MEAAQAFAELRSAVPQIEAAALFGSEPAAFVGFSEHAAAAAVRAAQALLEEADGLRGVGEATQIHASLADADVFVVRGHSRVSILAVAAPQQPAGLIFHALKRCLA